MLGIVTAGLRGRRRAAARADRARARSCRSASSATTWPVHKPDPEPLRVALRLAGDGHRPETSVYVGDAPTDMQMAVAVGARPVGIESVLGDPGDLRAAGADEIARSVAAWAGATSPRGDGR